MTKSIFASYTIWFGLLQMAYSIVGGLSGSLDSGTVQALFTSGLGTVLLRLKTREPII